MGKYFGTDGIRGLANVHPMNSEVALRLGMAAGYYFLRDNKKKNPKILIGKDTRISGYMIEQALAAGITSMGAHVLFLGPLPTPGIAYLTRGMRASAGIVISASHNPYHDNGIKLFDSNGFKLPDQVEAEIEDLIDSDKLSAGMQTHAGVGRARRIEDAIGQYAVFLKETFPKDLTLDGLRIVVDCANGAAYKTAPKVFEELGADLFVIGNEPNGRNINDQCGALYPDALAEKVRLYKADIGIALDGDADRLIVVDERGNVVDGDQLMAITALFLKEQGLLAKNTLVSTVMSNIGLDIAMKEHDIKMVRTAVGDRYVVEEMRKNGYNLGGEQSGHMVFLDTATTGDGILAALKILEVMLRQNKPLSELAKVLERVPQILLNVKISERRDFLKIPEIANEIKSTTEKLGDRGRILLRFSGTEKLLRIMIEGEDQHYITEQAEIFAGLARTYL